MTLARILARLRDSVGDGSIDEYHVRFFVGDVRAVVERLDACERVVDAARAYRSVSGGTAACAAEGHDLDCALAALDGDAP